MSKPDPKDVRRAAKEAAAKEAEREAKEIVDGLRDELDNPK